MPLSRHVLLPGLLLLAGLGVAAAQDTRGLGLPPPSGFQNPVLPPPSGSQNPVLPPPSGERYMPGIGGPFGEGRPRRAVPPRLPREDGGVGGSVSPQTQVLAGPEVDRIDQIGPALRRCWEPPALSRPEAGAMATVRFSVRRDGTLFGRPRLTWETRRGDAALQERFSDSVVAAVTNCTPLRLSRRFGEAIAGRPITIRFHGRAPSNQRAI